MGEKTDNEKKPFQKMTNVVGDPFVVKLQFAAFLSLISCSIQSITDIQKAGKRLPCSWLLRAKI